MQHARAHGLGGGYIPRSTLYQGRFGRIFGKLPPWQPPADEVVESFASNQMFEPAGAGAGLDNSELPAGYTYFGQFVDHDTTFDPTSSLQRLNDPNLLRNFRTPRLDLDSIYGSGPSDSPFLYDQSEPLKAPDGFSGFLLIGNGENANEDDLPRNAQDVALIGDMRNDENIIVSQIQLAFLKLHNKVLENIASQANQTFATQEQFEEARRIIRWFYQYVVWNDFVRRIVPPEVHADVLVEENGLLVPKMRFYDWKHMPFMPVEFSVAAYRFGHSLVRPGYQINISIGFGVEKPIFDTTGAGQNDLRGGRKLLANHSIQWDWFLEFPSSSDPFPQMARKVDTKLARSVFHIPAGPGITNPLALLNIRRGISMQLPAGTSVARAMGQTPITLQDPMEDQLWVYILKEAEDAGATRLGSVGGRIVAEVFAGMLAGDSLSFVSCDPQWTPSRESGLLPFGQPVNGGDWEFADIIRAAGMPINGSDFNNGQ